MCASTCPNDRRSCPKTLISVSDIHAAFSQTAQNLSVQLATSRWESLNKIIKKYRSRQQTIFRWKCAKTTVRATFLPQVITPSPSCGDKISKNLNCYNVFLILKCNFFPIPSSFFWLYRSLSDETVAAPWAKQNQGRINAEEIENTDNDQLGEEIEEEQMCGAPECDLR